MAGCTQIPHGPYEECTCDGCPTCDAQYNENLQVPGQPTMDMWMIATGGHVMGCDCDIDWEHVYGRHSMDCGYTEELGAGRCTSCEHETRYHDVDGRCWFTVEQGVPEKDSVCACLVRPEVSE